MKLWLLFQSFLGKIKMFLTGLVFIAALVLEVLGSYMSVVGLSSKSSLVLIILAISLDFSKVVVASVLYKNWRGLNFLFKLFLVPTTLFLMTITSYGAYAYLLQEFGKTTAKGEQMAVKLHALEDESKKLNDRKKEIDNQISSVDSAFVSQKKRLTMMFDKELTYINERTIQLDREIPELKLNKMSDNLEAGTLGSLAQAWGTTTEQTAKIIALMMVLVIDPLAIVMLMVGNFLQIKVAAARLAKKEESTKSESQFVESTKEEFIAGIDLAKVEDEEREDDVEENELAVEESPTTEYPINRKAFPSLKMLES
jgi:hypothetical protein